ncbi:unnamed protein product [Closterium sp. NIES-54]
MAFTASLPLSRRVAVDGFLRAPGTAAPLTSTFPASRSASGILALPPRAAFRGEASAKGAVEEREWSAAAAGAVAGAGAGEAVGLSRRVLLIGSGVVTAVGPWLAGDVARAADVAPHRYFKTPSGATVEEVYEGQGEAAAAGDAVTVHYVCRRSNGYFVASTIDPVGGDADPIDLLLGQGQVIQGLEEAVQGMRAGGRSHLCPSMMHFLELMPYARAEALQCTHAKDYALAGELSRCITA